jgi:hypothetical protein
MEPRKESNDDFELDSALRNFDLSERSQVRSSLRQRLVMSSRSRRTTYQGAKRMNTRKWLFSLAIPAIMLAVVILGATTPSVKARAQDLLRQVGQFLLVEDKQPAQGDYFYDEEGARRDAQKPTMPAPAFESVTEMDLNKASELAGFKGLESSRIAEGFTLTNRIVNALPDGVGLYSEYKNEAGGLLTVTQARYQTGAKGQEFWVGGTRVSDVNVRGQQGVWIEGISMGIPSSQAGQTEIVKLNALLWEEDGFTFLATTDVLSMEAVIDAANGLK